MAGEVKVPVFVSLRDEATKKLESQLGGLNKSFSNFGKNVARSIAGVTAFGAAIATNFLGESIDQAKNLERSLLSVGTVFGELAPRIEKFSASAAKFGLSQSEAAKASVFLGSVLKQSGFSMSETATLTERLVRLGTDLSATYGYDVQEALMGMTALFRGEYDPIEKFGVAMKQSEINSELAARGLDKLEGAARRFAEQQIRVELLFQRSQDAQGAFTRGAGTLYVETEKLRATFENLQMRVGTELTPAVTMLMQELQSMIPVIGEKLKAAVESVDWQKLVSDLTDFAFYILENIDGIVELGKQLAVTIGVIYALKIAIDAIIVVQTLWNLVVSRNPYVIAIGAIATLTGLVINLGNELNKTTEEVKEQEQAFREKIAYIRNSYLNDLAPAIDIVNGKIRETAGELNRFGQLESQAGLAAGNAAWARSWMLRGAAATAGDTGTGTGTGESQFQKVQKIIKDAQANLLKAERDYLRTKFELNRGYEEDVKKLREQAAKDQEDLYKESAKRLTDIFANASKTSLGDLFSSKTTTELETRITKLTDRLSVSVTREVSKTSAGAISDLITALNDRIAASRALITNASNLASKGFSQTFIEQVVDTGTDTGNALASAILNASPEMQDSLKTAFLDLETVSETGMDSVAKTLTDKFGLATRELNTQSKIIQEQLNADILEKQRTLATALADAAYAFGISVQDIRTEFEGVLDGLNGKFAGLDKTIDALLAKMGRLSNLGLTDTQAALTGPGGSLEGASVNDVEVVKNAITASGLVVDSASDLASSMAYVQARIAAAEKYIKSSSSGAAQEASAAASIASWTNELTKLAGATGAGAAGTVININVKTDSTQSVAMVGKTLGSVVTKYVTTGGQVLVSGTK